MLRTFANYKISKVRFLHDQSEPSNRFVSGTWNSTGHGNLTLWTVCPAEGGVDIERSCALELGAADVADICVINAQQFVASTTTGEVHIVDAPPIEAAGDQNEGGKLCTVTKFEHVHRFSASSALCVLDKWLFSGSDSGQIVRIRPESRSSRAVQLFAQDLMGVTSLVACGPFHLASAHTSGQLHLWDVRQKASAAGADEFSAPKPVISRPVNALNRAVTALATHPTQHDVIAFGSQDGVVSFIDIRQTSQLLPASFKVSQDPINQIKFHPLFANNCFSSSHSGLIHWDAGAFAREVNQPINGEPDIFTAIMEEDNSNEHRNIWVSPRASTNVNLRLLIEDEVRMISAFDVVQGAIVAGSHTAQIVYLAGVHFSN